MSESRRVVWVERGVAQLETCAMPQPAADQLLVRTRVSLISPGTERAFFLGLPNTSQIYPQYPGYSAVGEVIGLGSQVSGWALGERVACPSGHVAHAAVAASDCVAVPAGLADAEAVFFNLGAIALQGVRRARIELGEPVLVMGAGLIGLMALQLARLSGGFPTISVDQDGGRRAVAGQVGADAALATDAQLFDRVRELCRSDGPAVVIEATGSPNAIVPAFELARWGGRVVLLGSTRGETEEVNFYRDVHRKGLTVFGAHNNARPQHDSAPALWTSQDDQRVVLDLLAHGRLQVDPLITHRFGWQEAPEAYALLRSWELSALGMVLAWSSE